VLTDLLMPGVDGFRLIEESNVFRRRRPTGSFPAAQNFTNAKRLADVFLAQGIVTKPAEFLERIRAAPGTPSVGPSTGRTRARPERRRRMLVWRTLNVGMSGRAWIEGATRPLMPQSSFSGDIVFMMAVFLKRKNWRKTYRVGRSTCPLCAVCLSACKKASSSRWPPLGERQVGRLFLFAWRADHADSGAFTIDGWISLRYPTGERTRLRKSKIGFVFQKILSFATPAPVRILNCVTSAGLGKPERRFLKKITEMSELLAASIIDPTELPAANSNESRWPGSHQSPSHCARAKNHGNLDSKVQSMVLKTCCGQSNKDLGQTVLMITHNPEAAEYGDRIVL